jgi:acyl-[acyl-carrier-protein]-phospholipid O-acyltransferase/long-chain-fatty-acid--[acyl-carrier-protein] ligase
VTAVSDGRGGERLAVLHTVGPDQVDQALNHLKTVGLPNLFLPRRDHFVKVDALPMLGAGKLDLRAVKRTAEQALQSKPSDAKPAAEPVESSWEQR